MTAALCINNSKAVEPKQYLKPPCNGFADVKFQATASVSKLRCKILCPGLCVHGCLSLSVTNLLMNLLPKQTMFYGTGRVRNRIEN